MSIMIKTFAFGAGAAAIAAASPAAAQYYYPNTYANATQVAAQRCTAAVQARLNNRGTGGIIGAIVGNNYSYGGRVLSVTRVNPNRRTVRVRGLASSGRYAYAPYGVGAYGMLGYNYAPRADLAFKCDVDYRGYVRDVDINRR